MINKLPGDLAHITVSGFTYQGPAITVYFVAQVIIPGSQQPIITGPWSQGTVISGPFSSPTNIPISPVIDMNLGNFPANLPPGVYDGIVWFFSDTQGQNLLGTVSSPGVYNVLAQTVNPGTPIVSNAAVAWS